VSFSSYTTSHFHHALMLVIQSSCIHTWDAFQLAHASFRLYYVRNNYVQSVKVGPAYLAMLQKQMSSLLGMKWTRKKAVLKVFQLQEYMMKMWTWNFLSGVPCTLDACLLGALEEGLNALLNIEIRASKLEPVLLHLFKLNLPHGVVTMRCDITTCSSAHVSFLISGSAQTCFDISF